MKYVTRWLSVLCLSWVATQGNAEDLLEVYQAAQTNDAALRAARAGYAAVEQTVPQARSALLPSLAAGVQTTWNERQFPGSAVADPTSPLFGAEVPDQEFNDHGWSAQLRQPIVNVESWFNLSSAKAAVSAASYDLQAAEQDLILRVAQAYLNVLRAQDLLDSTSAEEAAVKRQLEQVQQRFDVGLVAITDVLESQAAYDAAEVRRIQAYGDHDIFFESLGTLTGISYERLNRLSQQLPIVNPNPRDEAVWVDEAMQANLNILAAQAQLSAASRTVRARASGHLPTLDATVTQAHSVTGAPNFFGADTADTTIYGLQFNMPLYSGGLVRARTKEASARKRQAEELLLNQRRTVTRDVRNLYQAVATDVVRVKARLRGIESARSALDATQTGYEVGTRNIVDVLQAQQLLFRSQFDYADSRYNYVLDLLALKDAAGALVSADLEELNTFTDAKDQVIRQVTLQQYLADPTAQ